MKTAEEIGKDYFPCTCGEIYLSRNLTAPDCPYHAFDWESAMQEYAQQIASLAWDAGVNFGVDEIWCPERGLKNEQPTKEQFLNSIFNNQQQEP